MIVQINMAIHNMNAMNNVLDNKFHYFYAFVSTNEKHNSRYILIALGIANLKMAAVIARLLPFRVYFYFSDWSFEEESTEEEQCPKFRRATFQNLA